MKCMQTLCNAESPMQQDDAVLPKKNEPIDSQ